MSLFLVVVATAAAAWCAVAPSSSARLRALSTQWRGSGAAGSAAGPGAGSAETRAARRDGGWLPRERGRLAASVLGGLGVAVVVGGVTGAALALPVGVAVWAGVGRLEPAAHRRRREMLAATLPLGVDLLAACLVAGRPPSDALHVVAQAVDAPLREELSAIAARLSLGVDPVRVWRQAPESVSPLARVMARSLETGAPAAEGLTRLADDLRGRRRAVGEQAARTVGVRATAPLGLCFLPAFVLVGIVPTVVSTFASLQLW